MDMGQKQFRSHQVLTMYGLIQASITLRMLMDCTYTIRLKKTALMGKILDLGQIQMLQRAQTSQGANLE
ncbi:hypothetical protein EL22_28755 [Halostagnicola sp. A56]|nr:hypothetical protein EL22_28755 [Halostagnicola sp. A56]